MSFEWLKGNLLPDLTPSRGYGLEDLAALTTWSRGCLNNLRGLALNPSEARPIVTQNRSNAEAWKQALASRRQVRKEWERARQDRALQGDWTARKQCKTPAKQGWEVEYADTQTRDPHDTVHKHLSSIYKGWISHRCSTQNNRCLLSRLMNFERGRKQWDAT